MRVLLACLFVIVVVVSVVSSANRRNTSGTASASEQDKKSVARWEIALGGAVTLRKSMRDPDSFKVSSALEMEDGAVCYQYRARNGFGGMNVAQAVFTGDRFIDESQPAFNKSWKTECAGKIGKDVASEINYALKQVTERE